MIALRIIGLVSIAALTMGSGAPGASIRKVVETRTSDQIEELKAVESPTVEVKAEAVSEADTQPVPAATLSMSNAAPAAATPGALLELALSNDYLQGRYFTENGLLGFDKAKGHVGFYFSDDRDLIGSIGLMTEAAQVFVDLDQLSLSVGARGYLALLASPNNADVFGLAPGVEARYPLPTAFPITAVGSLFYSPDILTLGDAENIVDLDLRGETEIMPGFVGFAGYRIFRFDNDEGADKKAANEIQIGGRFAF